MKDEGSVRKEVMETFLEASVNNQGFEAVKLFNSAMKMERSLC